MNDFTIFSKDYMKNVYILGGAFSEGCVMGEIYAINRIFYLKSHGYKYELKFEGIMDKSEKLNNLEVYCKKVDEYKILSNGIYFACDGEKEGEIKLNISADNVFNIKNTLLPKNEFIQLSNLLENEHDANDNIVITNAFSFIFNENAEGRIFGNSVINKHAFTRCSLNELREILDIQKEKAPEDIAR